MKRSHISILFGLSCYWPLFRKSWIDPIWTRGLDGNTGVWNLYFAFAISASIAAIAVYFARRKLYAKEKFSKRTCVLASALLAALNTLICYAPLDQIPHLVLFFDALLMAVVFVGLTAAWGMISFTLGGRTLLVEVFGSLAVSAALMFAAALPYPFGLVAPSVMPLASALLLPPCKTNAREPSYGLSDFAELPWGLVGMLALTNVVVALLYGIMPIDDTFSPNVIWLAIRFASFALSAFIVLLLYKTPTPQVPLTRIWLVLTVALVMAMFAIVIFPNSMTGVSKGLVLACQSCLNVLLWAVVVSACRMRSLSVIGVLPVLYVLLLVLSAFIANATAPFLAQLLPFEGNSWPVSITALFTLVVVLALIFYLGKRALRPNEKTEEERKGQVTALEKQLQEGFSLSSREAAVAALLARGNSVQKVSEMLFVSPSTVQSHMKSIYRKMGIHKKQELIDFAASLLQDEGISQT